LLQALAWQVRNEVSYNELAQTVGADKTTVSEYIDLLEKAFVVFRLSPFARNLRNEISSTRKIYFYDNGVRNTIINNFGSKLGPDAFNNFLIKVGFAVFGMVQKRKQALINDIVVCVNGAQVLIKKFVKAGEKPFVASENLLIEGIVRGIFQYN
jgi:predicted AAA+ superfamily ATPase